jgi:hypothetical protein
MIGLALDPGKSTGWAEFTWGKHTQIDPKLDTPFSVLAQGVISEGVDGFIRWFSDDLFDPSYYDVVIYEDFVIDGTVTGSWASEVIGALKMQSYNGGATSRIVRQTRQDKATIIGNRGGTTTQQREKIRFDWLREQGFTGVSHELDAITHGLVYVKRQLHEPTLKRFWRNDD